MAEKEECIDGKIGEFNVQITPSQIIIEGFGEFDRATKQLKDYELETSEEELTRLNQELTGLNPNSVNYELQKENLKRWISMHRYRINYLKSHHCGEQGFGAIGDVCRACKRFYYEYIAEQIDKQGMDKEGIEKILSRS